MKLLKFLLVISVLFPIGCAIQPSKSGVSGNTFYSSINPSINITVGSGFEYEGDKESLSHALTHTDRSTDVRRTRHIFQNNPKHRTIEINIYKIISGRFFWNPINYNHLKTLIDSGTTKINNQNYNYCVYTYENNGDCFLTKAIGRIVGTQSTTKYFINYTEKLLGEYCFRWKKGNSLNDLQKTSLNKFLEDFNKDIQINDYENIAGGNSISGT